MWVISAFATPAAETAAAGALLLPPRLLMAGVELTGSRAGGVGAGDVGAIAGG